MERRSLRSPLFVWGFRSSSAFVGYVEVGVVGFQGFDFGVVADHDVGVVGILEGVVLVIVFAGVEGFEGRDLGRLSGRGKAVQGSGEEARCRLRCASETGVL